MRSHPMQRRQQSRSVPQFVWLILFVSAIASVGGLVFGWSRYHGRKSPAGRYTVTDVRRANLYPTLIASGRVESSKKTVIECQLENVAVGVRGQRIMAGGASTLISVVADGTIVKKGDVLAVLDSSDYEELMRVQQISVERARADKLTAELNHEIARLAVLEFREGTMQETIEDYHRRVTLARSEVERARDRLNWTHAMKEKGYISSSTVATDEYTVAQAEESLKQEESAFLVFKKYSASRIMRELQGAVLAAEASLQYEQLRCQRQIDRLAMLEKQVKACTIVAPHDGFVIHANDARRQIVIEEGMPVRQRQPLFYLPDLKDMEVVAQLHESIVNDVRAGMSAKVEVESHPDREMDGRVKVVSQLPTLDWRSEVRYYDAIVKLDKSPDGLRPGMTAQIEFEMPRRQNVLAVPTEAVTSADGHDICFVVHEEGLERRDVKLGQVTREMTEVTQGLREGEQVVLNPVLEETDLTEATAPADVAATDTSRHAELTPGEVAALH